VNVPRSLPPSKSFLLLVVVLLVPFWQPLSMMVDLALTDERYSHIILVPFISLCVLCFERKTIMASAHYEPRVGFPLLAAGLAIFLFLRYHLAAAPPSLVYFVPSMVAVWAAGFVLCYGGQSLRAAAFPACLLLLMVPVPERVLNLATVGLQKGSAEMTYVLFKLSGLPVFRQGFRFSLPGVEIEIAEQCSGIRSSIALLVTSLLAGHAFLRSRWSKGTLVLFTVPVVIFKNALRILTLSVLGAYVNRAFLYGNLHRRGGLLFALLAVLILIPAILALQRAERRTGPTVVT
jgi:exosortase